MLHAVTEESIRVRYGETDPMGHAYYANYLFWFEQARGAWCRARGFSYKDLEAIGYMLPVVEVYARYKGEVRYDDEIKVRVWLEETKRSAVLFKYQVVGMEDTKVKTEGHTWHVLMGRERKATTIPPHVQEMFDRSPLSELKESR
jgi:acyl-CoA thioester hydrolase